MNERLLLYLPYVALLCAPLVAVVLLRNHRSVTDGTFTGALQTLIGGIVLWLFAITLSYSYTGVVIALVFNAGFFFVLYGAWKFGSLFYRWRTSRKGE